MTWAGSATGAHAQGLTRITGVRALSLVARSKRTLEARDSDLRLGPLNESV